jgi:uncharacterized repeat protein (TIGR02543 family)
MLITMLPTQVLAADESAETVVYNLGSEEITVGSDQTQAEEMPWLYKLFDDSGNYTIELEDNAFFPYEIQFTVDGESSNVWFDTPESTVEIGGHTFSVTSAMYDTTKLMQAGVYIGGDYVMAKPEPKDFNAQPMMMMRAMLPITEVTNLTLDLTGYTPSELSAVSVSAIVAALNADLDTEEDIDGSSAVVWLKMYSDSSTDDDYSIVTQGDAIDLTPLYYDDSNSEFCLELIVGTANQLDPNNTRYIITVTTSDLMLLTNVELYKQDGGRSAITPLNEYKDAYWEDYYECYYQATLPESAEQAGQNLYLGFTLSSLYSKYTPTVYAGYFETADEAAAAAVTDPTIDVTSHLLGQTMTNPGAGLNIGLDEFGEYGMDYTVVLKDNGTVVEMHDVYVSLSTDKGDIHMTGLYSASPSWQNIVWVTDRESSSAYDSTITYTLEQGFNANGTYNLGLAYYDGETGLLNNAKVDAAYVGNYASLAAAAGQTDISGTLFPDSFSSGSGYAANYSGNGVTFTIFTTDSKVYHYTIKAIDYMWDNTPDNGSADTYFHVDGAHEITNAYVVPYEHDSYYTNGYQTILTTDSVDLSSLTPVFTTGSGVHIYAGNPPTLQFSSVTHQDFSAGTVQYSAAAQNGSNLKNYWISFIKKSTDGAKLFVNGPTTREVFLDNSYDNRHDIFLANVGNAQLTGIDAVLNATNVKLDPYWKVGGAGNDELAAFTNTTRTTTYGELSNVAKIRLLPNGEGPISGTLTIKAAGQSDVVVTLQGYSGNPSIVTDSIPGAVKYVPYSSIIQTSNMHDWNQITFSLESGSLPHGIVLKPNGEIYGVPTEAGSFPFEVRMENSYSGFGDDYASYTLVVDNNTAANVEAQTDAGYPITDRVPDMSAYQEDILTIDNAASETEFINLWLDGNKLTRNADYTVEHGSTKITIRSQTFQSAGNGEHTIAAEFRVDGDLNKELKKAAQNYTVTSGGGSGGSGGGGGGGGGGGSVLTQPCTLSFNTNGGSSISVATKNINTTIDLSAYAPTRKGYVFGGWYSDAALTNHIASIKISANTTIFAKWTIIEDEAAPAATSGSFHDVNGDNWFFNDVEWANKQGLMLGAGNNSFAPHDQISDAMVVTVLARLAAIDLSAYGDANDQTIFSGQWYSKEAAWASEKGLITGDSFTPNPPTPRGDLAVMLVRYFDVLGIKYTVPTQDIQFADADEMTADENHAFQILYSIGIFQGKGGMTMNSKGATTRAELAALLHRVSVFIDEQK